MEKVNVRDLRNHGGDILDRVNAGHELVVERSGTPVARLVPVTPDRLDARALIERRRSLPVIDVAKFRHDIDTVIDASV